MLNGFINQNIDRLIGSALVFILMIVTYTLVRIFLTKTLKQQNLRQTWINRLFYIVVIVGSYVVGEIWFEALRIFTALASLIGAALIVTHKEFILNISAHFLIKRKKLFKTGDHISIKNANGKVLTIGWQNFTVFSKSDRQYGYIKVPNHFIFQYELINHYEPYECLRVIFSTCISNQSNPIQAKKMLSTIVMQHTQTHYIELHANFKKSSASSLPEPTVFLLPDSNDPECIRLESQFFASPDKKKVIIDAITQDWIIAVQQASDIHFIHSNSSVSRLTALPTGDETHE
jgi:small-conductance mechanosensitive channel